MPAVNSVSFYAASVPEPEAVETNIHASQGQAAQTQQLKQKLQALFQKRPIWSYQLLAEQLPGENFEPALGSVSYKFKTGGLWGFFCYSHPMACHLGCTSGVGRGQLHVIGVTRWSRGGR